MVNSLENILAGEAEGIGTVLSGEQEAQGAPHCSYNNLKGSCSELGD